MVFDFYEEYKLEMDHQAFSDYCCNLGIEIEDTELLRNDDVLSELIIREHDSYYGVTYTEEKWAEYEEEEIQDRIDADLENQADEISIERAFAND